jgi:hypothetical protein
MLLTKKEGILTCSLIHSDINRDDVVGVIAGEGDARHVGMHTLLASIDGHVAVGVITTGRMA